MFMGRIVMTNDLKTKNTSIRGFKSLVREGGSKQEAVKGDRKDE